MTLIFEIAAGIVLGVATLAFIVVFWKGLSVALMGLVTLIAAGVGIAIFYGICGGWENAGSVAVIFGVMGGAAWLIGFLNNHEKYGLQFRAMGNAIVVCAALIIPASLLLLPSLVDIRGAGPYAFLPIVVALALAVRFYYPHAIKRELNATQRGRPDLSTGGAVPPR